MEQDVGRVEHLRQVVDADDARLRQQRVNRRIGRPVVRLGPRLELRRLVPVRASSGNGRAPGSREPRRSACAGTPDGRCGRTCADCRRTRGRAARLGGLVVLPVAQQVVAADIGLVADGDERRDAEPDLAARGRRSPRRSCPTATRWRAGPGGRRCRQNVACIATAGSVLITPRQFGPISRIPWLRANRHQISFGCAPSPPTSAKPDEMTTSPCTRLRRALLDDLGEPRSPAPR